MSDAVQQATSIARSPHDTEERGSCSPLDLYLREQGTGYIPTHIPPSLLSGSQPKVPSQRKTMPPNRPPQAPHKPTLGLNDHLQTSLLSRLRATQAVTSRALGHNSLRRASPSKNRAWVLRTEEASVYAMAPGSMVVMRDNHNSEGLCAKGALAYVSCTRWSGSRRYEEGSLTVNCCLEALYEVLAKTPQLSSHVTKSAG